MSVPSTLRAAAVVALSAVLGCDSTLPAEGQIELYIDTDAPLPAPIGAPFDPLRPEPLFDRLRLDVVTPGQTLPCASCTRELFFSEDLAGTLSFGVIAEEGSTGTRVRARLFRSASSVDGEPSSGTTIDVTASLPEIPTEGVEPYTLFLPTDAVATPIGSLDAPIAASPGAPLAGHAGEWPGAARTPCGEPPPPHQVCIPGGAYWMGETEPLLLDTKDGAVDEERLVVLRPYFLDRTEVTVGAFRAWWEANPTASVSPWSGSASGTALEDYCSFDPSGVRDSLPLNCVIWNTAREYCRSLGDDLPTEAQHEFVARRFRSQPYVWGSDPPACGDAIFEQTGGPIIQNASSGTCLVPESVGGPAIPGSGARDRLLVAGVEIVDLIGNVGEFARDSWQSQEGPCWPAGILFDPVCDPEGSAVDGRVRRGGAWLNSSPQLHAALRRKIDPIGRDIANGFRCARDAQ